MHAAIEFIDHCSVATLGSFCRQRRASNAIVQRHGEWRQAVDGKNKPKCDWIQHLNGRGRGWGVSVRLTFWNDYSYYPE